MFAQWDILHEMKKLHYMNEPHALNTEQRNPKKEYAVYDSIHIKWTEKLIYTVQNQDDDMKGFGNAGDILFKDLSSGYMDMSSL